MMLCNTCCIGSSKRSPAEVTCAIKCTARNGKVCMPSTGNNSVSPVPWSDIHQSAYLCSVGLLDFLGLPGWALSTEPKQPGIYSID